MFTTRCLPVLFISTLALADLPLPPYVKPCARNDPNLDACTVKHGNDAISELVKGDRKYGIPPLNPFEISEIEVPTNNLNVKVTNAKVNGLQDADLKRASYDFKGEQEIIELFFPRLQMLGHYQIDGRILVLPITGNGEMNLTLDNATVKTHAIMKVVQRDGKEYLEFRNLTTQVEPQRIYVRLSNLFNGNKVLGDEMNELLNREWKAAFRDIGAPIIETANTVIQSLSDSFAKNIPLDVFFPEKV